MLLIKNGLLVGSERTSKLDMAIENGKIARIDRNLKPAPGDEMLDASGLFVLPGFIDAHTHLDMDNGVTVTADDFPSGTRAALAGGTTTIVDFATQDRGGTLKDALSAWHKKADGRSNCHYGFHMAITDWNERTLSELPQMFAAGVSSFKLYLAYDALRLSDRAVYEILLEMKKLGGIVGVHCENGDLVDAMVDIERNAGRMGPDAHPRARPPYVEAEAISRLLYIAALADCAVNIVHLSSEAGLKEVRKARARGQTVYVETCPQYLLMEDSRYRLPGLEGLKYVCSPPIRSESDRRALVSAMLTGEVDTVATDHCSYTTSQKALGKDDFSKIPNGLPGIEHRPNLMFSGFCEEGALSLSSLCRLLCENPARLFGMYPQKGVLKEGSDGDIVLLQGDVPGEIRAETQLQNTDYTPYEGVKTRGIVKYVLLNGEIAVRDGRVTREGLGRYVPRQAVSV